MKRLCFLCLLGLLTWNVRANYTPFVVEGKTWVMEHSFYNATKVMSETYVLSGDTIINNLLYKKLLIDGRYEGAYREEGRKVYAIWTGTTKELMLYDFNLEVGDKYIVYDFYGNPDEYEVRLSDSINTCGHALHRIGLGFPTDDEFNYNWLNIWIEGVGSAWGPESSIYFTATGTGANIRSCRVGNDYLYKDTLQEFVSPKLAWADGYTKDGIVYINRHNMAGTRDVDGQTYTMMRAQQYIAPLQGEVSEGMHVDYLLREDAEGEAWLRTENPLQIAALYGISLDTESADLLADHDLYLFNTRVRNSGCMSYGHLVSFDELRKSWQIEKANVERSSFIALENKKYTWQHSLSGNVTPQFLMSVGWMGYGPFYGFGDAANDGKRLFPILYEGDNVVYRDEECMEFLRTNVPSLLETITNTDPVTYTAGQMATIILPTPPDASKGKYYRLDRYEDGQIVFEQELEPQAHVPYIIVPNEDFSIDLRTLDLTGLSRDTVSIAGISFIGSYVSETFDYPDGFYIDFIDITPDCRFEESCVIGALRAYLLVQWDDPYNQGGTRVPPLNKMGIVLRDYETGITSPLEETGKGAAIYNLAGQQIAKSQKGINIIRMSDGTTRKILIK